METEKNASGMKTKTMEMIFARSTIKIIIGKMYLLLLALIKTSCFIQANMIGISYMI